MAHARFDPSHAVRFDLSRGQVRLDGRDDHVLVPSAALLELCREAGDEVQRGFGRRLGTEIGRRVAARLGAGPGAVEGATIAAVVEHLGGDLALAGLGSLSLERWGRALVLRIDGSPFGADGDALLGAVLQGAIQRAMSRDAAVLRLDRDADRARFLVTSHAAAARARAWLGEGKAWGEVLTSLQAAGGEA
jgi:hypothetical protein